MVKQFFSLFSGIGGSAFGAKQAGYDLLGGVEMDEQIANLYVENHGSSMIISDVKNVNIANLPMRSDDLLCLQISSPCQDWSGSNCHANPTSSRALALDNCYHILKHYAPEQIVIENVRAYQGSPPMDRFRDWLLENGYQYQEQIINCADLGLPQTRIRYFLMATKIGMPLRPIVPTHSRSIHQQMTLFDRPLHRWIGWYEAIADLIPSMPVTELSNNQRLAIAGKYGTEPILMESRTRTRSSSGRQDRLSVRSYADPAITVLAGSGRSGLIPKILIPTIGYHGDLPPMYEDFTPAPTVKAMMMSDRHLERKGCWRLLDGVEVRECSVRGLARLQSFPDDLKLTGRNSLDCRGVGNGVPPLILQRILEQCF